MENPPENNDWLYDYIIQFLRSPAWRIPIMAFTDQNCLIFDNEDQNKFIYSDVFNNFKDMIDTILENLCIQVGVSYQQFVQVYQRGLKSPSDKRIFQQVLACDNFLSFKKLMIKRNKELQEQALQQLSLQGQVPQQEVVQASANRQQAQLQHAIAVSLAFEDQQTKLLRQQEEELQRILKQSEQQYNQMLKKKEEQEKALKRAQDQEPPKDQERIRKQQQARRKLLEQKARIDQEQAQREAKRKFDQAETRQVQQEIQRAKEKAYKREENKRTLSPIAGRTPAVPADLARGQVDVSKEREQAEILRQKAENIASQNTGSGTGNQESLEERQARLRQQRDLILAQRRQINIEDQSSAVTSTTHISLKEIQDLQSHQQKLKRLQKRLARYRRKYLDSSKQQKQLKKVNSNLEKKVSKFKTRLQKVRSEQLLLTSESAQNMQIMQQKLFSTNDTISLLQVQISRLQRDREKMNKDLFYSKMELESFKSKINNQFF